MTTAVSVYTEYERGRMGDLRYVIFDWSMTTYTTGGNGLTPAKLGLSDIVCMPPAIGLGGTLQPNTFTYDMTNQKVQAWKYTAAQAAEATDASNAGKAYRMIVYGH
jgi:hypothetical protein